MKVVNLQCYACWVKSVISLLISAYMRVDRYIPESEEAGICCCTAQLKDE
jgi:hypothetical protein